MATSEINSLLAVVDQQGKAYNPNIPSTQAALHKAAQELPDALQPASTKVAKLGWQDVADLAFAIRVCADMKLFKRLSDAGTVKTAREIATLTDTDRALVAEQSYISEVEVKQPLFSERLLKHLSTAKYVAETGPGTNTPNPVTDTLANPQFEGLFTNCYDLLSTTNSKAIDFFRRSKGFKTPDYKDKSLFKYAFDTEMHYFDWLFQLGNEEQAAAFQNHMKMKTMGPKWFQAVPIQEILGSTIANEVLLVDVGGAAGHDLQAFHKAFPDLPGRLVLQDRPESIQSLDAAALVPVEPMGHDFFTPQPIKGAQGYYLKMVLHDWPDKQCKPSLENLKAALVHGQSKILINEIVIPEIGADWFETSVDVLMMLCHAAHERREKEWQTLVESAGPKITKFWQCGEAPEKLIVVELPKIIEALCHQTCYHGSTAFAKNEVLV